MEAPVSELHIQTLLIVALSFAQVSAVDGGSGKSTLTEYSLDTARQSVFQLTSRIKAIRLKSDETGVYKIRFESGSWRFTEIYMRGVTAYSTAESPRVFLVQEFPASNEDRIVIYDWSTNPPAQVTLEHPDANGYIHAHYKVGPCNHGVVQVTELQYAGDEPPRKRDITISLVDQRHRVRNGTWMRDPD
jgi:hypothetical protein